MQVLAAKEQYELIKLDREQAQTDVLAHGRVMVKVKQEEVEAAEKITDDHVHACDQGKSLGDLFPSVQARKKAESKLVRFTAFVSVERMEERGSLNAWRCTRVSTNSTGSCWLVKTKCFARHRPFLL